MNLTIVIVSFNASDFLRQCLLAIYEHKHFFDYEIIVVDNNSHDDSCAMIKRDFPHVRLIENKENVGFARANNQGIAAALGVYVLMLNSDTKVTNNAIDEMVRYLDKEPTTAVVTGRLVYPDLTDQNVARAFPTPMNAFFGRKSLPTRLFPNNRYSRKYHLHAVRQSRDPFEIDWGSGACLMARKTILVDVGLLDENFFMYWEDADLCYRIKQKGWKIICIPEAVVIHYEGKSSSTKMSNRLIIEFNRSAYRYYRKHHVRSFFEIMHFVAIIGFFARTLALLFANIFKLTQKQDSKTNIS